MALDRRARERPIVTAHVLRAHHRTEWLVSENGGKLRFLVNGAPGMNMMGTQIIGKSQCS